MKIVVSILVALLLTVGGAAAYFYLNAYKPMAADHARMKAAMPELDRNANELRRYKEKEAWIKPVADSWKAVLSEELKDGSAEVVAAPNGTVVVNIKEQFLYTPGVVTFAKDSPTLREKLLTLLKNKDLTNKEIIIANMTGPGAGQGKGRRKIPGKDARELAADRSLALIKYFEKNGVSPELLSAGAYPEKLPDRGFGIKDRKTVIIISAPGAPAPGAAAPKPAPPEALKPGAPEARKPQPAPEAKAPVPPQQPGAAPGQPKPIPITPAQPKQP